MPYKDKEKERARSRTKAIRQYHQKKNDPEWYAEKIAKNAERAALPENKERQRERLQNRKKLHKQKCLERLGSKCVRCGTTEKLEFDHIDKSTKEYQITSRLSCSLERLFEEVDKCQLLCNGCHIQKSLEKDDYRHRRQL